MQYTLGVALGVFTLIVITRPFTVLFHELGHAIPVMLLTKKGATVYIGSYGDERESFKIHLGQLDIWFRYNPIKWGGGLCVPEAKGIPPRDKFIFILCGPLLSLVFATCICYLTFAFDLHGALKIICAFALGSAILDFIFNLIPQKIRTRDGRMHTSDGKLLLMILKLKKFPNEYADAVSTFQEKEYAKAAKLFGRFIGQGLVNEEVYRYAATSNFYLKKYEKSLSILRTFENNYKPNSDDYYNLGLTNFLLKFHDEADKYFKKSLEQNPDNPYPLNALGYDLNSKGKYHEALLLFNKAIENNSDFGFAYANRGHAKIELGQFDDGLGDIKHAMELEKGNPYTYRNLGIYHLYKNEKEIALRYFKQCKEMDKDTDLIDEFIKKAMS